MSKRVDVLLLGYKARVGKDTVGEFLKDLGFVRVAFADKLKETVADLYGFTPEQMYGPEKDQIDPRYPNHYDFPFYEISNSMGEKEGVFSPRGENWEENPDFKPFLTPRRVLQIFGQQQRELNPNIWASYVFNSTVPSLLEKGHTRIVVTDFRFKNEALFAKEWAQRDSICRKVTTIQINRPSVHTVIGSGDISEVELDSYSFDNVILNDGSLDSLKDKSLRLVTSLLKH